MLTVEKDIKVRPDAQQFRHVNQEVIVMNESRKLNSEEVPGKLPQG